MEPSQKIVTRIPLTELWNDRGSLVCERIGNIDRVELTNLVATQSVQFIVANCGCQLNWIPLQETLVFWKSIRNQIADPRKPISLGQFPNESAYIASQWRGANMECLILLEMHH